MGILKINDDKKAVLQNCRTYEDIKLVNGKLGAQLSEKDLDAVCGGLAEVEPDKVQEEMDKKMAELMDELRKKGIDVNVLFPRETPSFPGPRNVHIMC